MGVASCAILLALFCILLQASKRRHMYSSAVPKAFYSDDDGQTWFVDDAMKPVPFDHNGKQAFRVKVFRCSGGQPFVGYLERYSDADNARLAAAGTPKPDYSGFGAAEPAARAVRRPGEEKWIGLVSGPQSMAEYNRIISPTCLDSAAEKPSLLAPTDPDNGSSN
jgi:hypothetical protein